MTKSIRVNRMGCGSDYELNFMPRWSLAVSEDWGGRSPLHGEDKDKNKNKNTWSKLYKKVINIKVHILSSDTKSDTASEHPY